MTPIKTRTSSRTRIEPEAIGDEGEDARGVDVADELQRVLGAIGQLVDVDEQRVDLLRRLRVSRSDPLVVPLRPLQLRVDLRELVVEQLVVVAELEELRVRELENLERRL